MAKTDSGTPSKNQNANKRKILLIIPDQLSGRVFFECGIVKNLLHTHGQNIECIFNFPVFDKWSEEHSLECYEIESLLRIKKGNIISQLRALIDSLLDRWIGFFPISIRFNLRNNFHLERMSPGHSNAYLDLARIGVLPQSDLSFNFMAWWLYSRWRFIDPSVMSHLQNDVSMVVISNLQHPAAISFFLGAKRLNIPVIGYIASWDHLVGKGIVYPRCRRYIVQNNAMEKDLRQYHGIPPERITITGWPQSDVYGRKFPRMDYVQLLVGYDLDISKPVVLITGNSVTNAPYEPLFFKRLVEWWNSIGGIEKLNLIFRPHPRDLYWEERFDYKTLKQKDGLHIQTPSFTDFEILTILLQHVDCVITNAGTILLDSLGNGRPVVSVLYDEGTTEQGLHTAYLNVLGEHYKELMASDAFYQAFSFEQVITCIETCLHNPREKEESRRAVCGRIFGEIDGMAAERVSKIILSETS